MDDPWSPPMQSRGARSSDAEAAAAAEVMCMSPARLRQARDAVGEESWLAMRWSQRREVLMVAAASKKPAGADLVLAPYEPPREFPARHAVYTRALLESGCNELHAALVASAPPLRLTPPEFRRRARGVGRKQFTRVALAVTQPPESTAERRADLRGSALVPLTRKDVEMCWDDMLDPTGMYGHAHEAERELDPGQFAVLLRRVAARAGMSEEQLAAAVGRVVGEEQRALRGSGAAVLGRAALRDEIGDLERQLADHCSAERIALARRAAARAEAEQLRERIAAAPGGGDALALARRRTRRASAQPSRPASAAALPSGVGSSSALPARHPTAADSTGDALQPAHTDGGLSATAPLSPEAQPAASGELGAPPAAPGEPPQPAASGAGVSGPLPSGGAAASARPSTSFHATEARTVALTGSFNLPGLERVTSESSLLTVAQGLPDDALRTMAHELHGALAAHPPPGAAAGSVLPPPSAEPASMRAAHGALVPLGSFLAACDVVIPEMSHAEGTEVWREQGLAEHDLATPQQLAGLLLGAAACCGATDAELHAGLVRALLVQRERAAAQQQREWSRRSAAAPSAGGQRGGSRDEPPRLRALREQVAAAARRRASAEEGDQQATLELAALREQADALRLGEGAGEGAAPEEAAAPAPRLPPGQLLPMHPPPEVPRELWVQVLGPPGAPYGLEGATGRYFLFLAGTDETEGLPVWAHSAATSGAGWRVVSLGGRWALGQPGDLAEGRAAAACAAMHGGWRPHERHNQEQLWEIPGDGERRWGVRVSAQCPEPQPPAALARGRLGAAQPVGPAASVATAYHNAAAAAESRAAARKDSAAAEGRAVDSSRADTALLFGTLSAYQLESEAPQLRPPEAWAALEPARGHPRAPQWLGGRPGGGKDLAVLAADREPLGSEAARSRLGGCYEQLRTLRTHARAADAAASVYRPLPRPEVPMHAPLVYDQLQRKAAPSDDEAQLGVALFSSPVSLRTRGPAAP
eukprot:TRINITY_DN6149_c3_g1_i1.p1 TRINITY_DN6149_c3_g1~~TRINITY_DN6149_c3_g1_i1.p1  ORF type:complete len:991 (+),score=225.22 TRINITY_DN6149_c3_g1_i1:81-3053(+)